MMHELILTAIGACVLIAVLHSLRQIPTAARRASSLPRETRTRRAQRAAAADDLDVLAERIESGELTSDELRQLMKTGTLRIR